MTFRKLITLFTVLSLLMALSVASVAAQDPEEESEGIVEPLEAPLEPVAGQDVETEEVIDSEGNVVEDIEEGLIEVELAEPVSPADAETEGIAEPAELEAPVEVSEEETIVTADVVEGSAAIDKALSTNVNYQNLGSSAATVTANYLLSTGSAWPGVPTSGNDTETPYNSFTIPVNGSVQHRHYTPFLGGNMQTGSGSVSVTSNQQLGAVVQIVARGQVGTSGAYVGVSSGAETVLVPQAFKNWTTGDGVADTQLAIQNVGGSAQGTITLNFYDAITPSDSPVGTYVISNLGVGVSSYVNLTSITPSSGSIDSSPDGDAFIGSIEIVATGGAIAAVVNNFFGDNGLHAYNGFGATEEAATWFIPLFSSQRSTGSGTFNTPVNIQNTGSSPIAADAVTLTCGSTISVSNPAAIPPNGAYSFNPFFDPDNLYQDGFIGACTLSGSGIEAVVFSTQRFNLNGDTSNAAAVRSFSTNDSGTDLRFPIVSRQLTSNGYSSSISLQNTGTTPANVTLNYNTSPESGSGTSNFSVNYTIQPGEVLEQNHRLGDDFTGSNQLTDSVMPRDWFGSLTVTSDQPIVGQAQFTYFPVGGGGGGDETALIAGIKVN